MTANKSPDAGRFSVEDLQKIDLINKNAHLSKSFKPFTLGLFLLILGCVFGFAVFISLPHVSINQFIFGIIFSLIALLIFAKFYLIILWRIKNETMRQEDFVLLTKRSDYQAGNEKKVIATISTAFALSIVIFGSSFTLTLAALLLSSFGLFFLLFAAIFSAKHTYS